MTWHLLLSQSFSQNWNRAANTSVCLARSASSSMALLELCASPGSLHSSGESPNPGLSKRYTWNLRDSESAYGSQTRDDQGVPCIKMSGGDVTFPISHQLTVYR